MEWKKTTGKGSLNQNSSSKDKKSEKPKKPKCSSSQGETTKDIATTAQSQETNNNGNAEAKSGEAVSLKVEPSTRKTGQMVSKSKFPVPASADKNSNPKRFARCGHCPPCLAESCGECHSCQMWAQHRDKAVDSVACERNVCEKPISLFGSRVVQDQHRQMDGVCPLRMVNGRVYDFRCYICKVLPRVGSANRSELYRHYTIQHYSSELTQEFGTDLKSCPRCYSELGGRKNGGAAKYISHLGQVHNEVEKYLPHHAKIPLSVQAKSGGGRRIRRRQAVVTSRVPSNNNDHWFPEVPEGWDPRGDVREIYPTDAISHFSQTMVIDGFVISNELDEDVEPLMVSRGEVDEVVMPNYEDSLGGKCLICKKHKKTISELVHHIHKRHGILGGSQYLMLDADRLLKGGYISIN